MKQPVCIGVGVGPGNGAAIARWFAAGGFATALVARRPHLVEELARELGPPARAYRCDAADPSALERTFGRIDRPDAFFVRPVDVASTVLAVVRQPSSAWSFEVEARPFGEKW